MSRLLAQVLPGEKPGAVSGVKGTAGPLHNTLAPVLVFAMLEPLPEFDPTFYRASYADLTAMTDAQLLAHWEQFGIDEGRQASRGALKPGLLSLIEPSDRVLEIGPFTNPAVTGSHVRYFDVMDREGLAERARAIGYPLDRAVPIDFVSPTADLSVVDRQFDVVVSCHCIEHQPDLIRHLAEVGRILRPGGAYLLVIPDKRYCFDHFIPEATFAKVIGARGRVVHVVESVVEHRAHVAHNDARRHWAGDHGVPAYEDDPERVARAVGEFEAAQGGYIDVHAWQFTPSGFGALMRQLHDAGQSPLAPRGVYQTPRDYQEFCAALSRN